MENTEAIGYAGAELSAKRKRLKVAIREATDAATKEALRWELIQAVRTYNRACERARKEGCDK
jgi:hypothetical protein